jgi:hypothetical protein
VQPARGRAAVPVQKFKVHWFNDRRTEGAGMISAKVLGTASQKLLSRIDPDAFPALECDSLQWLASPYYGALVKIVR